MKTLLLVVSLIIATNSYATASCDHPHFYVKGCPIEGVKGDKGEKGDPGERGPQGEQGVAGRDGVDGKDGRDGAVGPAGLPGADGVNYNGSHLLSRAKRYISLSSALDIHQSDEGHRVSVGAAGTGGTYGLGLGYSYRNDKNQIFKIGAGRSGSETLVKGSMSFEF